ncbi:MULTISPECIES: DUF6445 family protein [Sphingomonas]|uniref:DUF6445 family protein n=1 Tax=Sphingomonas TaxID=13687 RepID=UPI000DEF07C8|nr:MULTISPECIES: DUF6445 family protein [Sphingomonas]
MLPELRRVGREASPVVVIDDFSGDAEAVAALADELAPFPPAAGNYYPGLRRFITAADTDADAYARRLCESAAPFLAGAFDIDEFDLLEASFSLVTTAPAALAPAQRAPHFDTPDPRHFALLHYLRVPEGSGTAFYRQRSTGIEMVTEQNVATFVRAAETAAAALAPDAGYIGGSDAHYEQIGAVEAVADRLVIYQGSLLHSGIIPPTMAFSGDPREGRLTANLFVKGR